jgi:Tol biopolymer transport system component
MADLDGKIIRDSRKHQATTERETCLMEKNDLHFNADGDLDLYVMDLKSLKVKRITNKLGYDGGAWFSRDGKKIIWRASRPGSEEEQKEYKDLLAQGVVAPTQMEVFIANADGSNQQQITHLGQANWAPNFLPDGSIIFCSNHEYKRGFPFNMYTMKTDGSQVQKISRDKDLMHSHVQL